jgi:hypothetical protein
MGSSEGPPIELHHHYCHYNFFFFFFFFFSSSSSSSYFFCPCVFYTGLSYKASNFFTPNKILSRFKLAKGIMDRTDKLTFFSHRFPLLKSLYS